MTRYAVAWAIPSSIAPARLAALVASLAPDERERAASFAIAADRLAYAVAHGLLRRLLSCHGEAAPADWRFTHTANGKPVLADGPLAFSLAHTRALVACVVTRRGAIGIDVERVADAAPEHGVVSAACAASEAETLARLEARAAALAFARLWTMKEAAIKALGAGPDLSYARIECALDPPRIVRAAGAESRGARWSIASSVPVAGHVMSVAQLRESRMA